MNNKPYTIYINYFATGEGITFFYSNVYAENKNDAIEKFRYKFECFKHEKAWEYFSLGMKIEEGLIINNEIRPYFGDIILFNYDNHGICEITLQLHVPSVI